MLKIAPSVIAADFSKLGDQLREAEQSGADVIHFDAMDGHFVPNITIGPFVLEAVRKMTSLRIDAHLMLREPERYIAAFAQAGADTIAIHVEATVHLHRALDQIRSLGKRSGVALNPSTPAVLISEVLENADQVVVMTVNPGFGGQKFIPQVMRKVRELRAAIGARSIDLCVDGGVNLANVRLPVENGADLLIAGTAIFKHPGGIAFAIREMREAARG